MVESTGELTHQLQVAAALAELQFFGVGAHGAQYIPEYHVKPVFKLKADACKNWMNSNAP